VLEGPLTGGCLFLMHICRKMISVSKKGKKSNKDTKNVRAGTGFKLITHRVAGRLDPLQYHRTKNANDYEHGKIS